MSSHLDQTLAPALAERRAAHLYRTRKLLQSPQTPNVIVDGKNYLAFCSNDYLGLANHPDVIAAQGTVGLEILAQVPDVTTVIVPIGGGGLMAGVSSAIKQKAAEEGKEIRVIGVQAENAAAYPPSLKAGHPVEVTG